MAAADGDRAGTAAERRAEVRRRFPCLADCEACGNCRLFRGQDPEAAFADYIEGRRTFEEVFKDYRRI